MAGTNRTTTHAVIEQALREDPSGIGFFYAVRQLECAHADQPRLGASTRISEESMRLGQRPAMEFAPVTLADWVECDSEPQRLLVYFFGLFGPQGALPLHLTEYALERQREKDNTFIRFCDVFHHRMLSLFYRAWANSDPAVSFDRPEQDRFGDYLASLFGLGLPALRQRDALPDLAKLCFTGHLSCQTRHPQGLQAMILEFFGVSVHIREFVGEWMNIPPEDWTRLGASPRNASLGVSAVAGARVWGRQNKFRIVLGPLNLRRYQDFLPGGISLGQLVALVRNYLGDEMAWDVNLILHWYDVPELTLDVPPLQCRRWNKEDNSTKLTLDGSVRLGWTTWMGERKKNLDQGDADDLCLNPFFGAHAYQLGGSVAEQVGAL